MGSPASIAGTIGIALVASGVATVASAQTITWNHNLFGPPRAVTAGMEAMAEFYKKESNGTFEIKLAYGSALGPEKQIPEGIKSGGYEGGMMCAGYYPNKFPLLSVMELPFLAPRGIDENAKVNQAVLNHPLIVKEMAERWNMKYLAPTFLPAFEFMGNKRIASVADMKGVKMRISGLNAQALKVFGAVPTMVTAPEGYEALQRGTIDSFGFPYSFAFGAYKLHEVSKHVTEGMAMSGFLCFQGVSLAAWNKLPDNLKAKLPEAQELAAAALLKAFKADDQKWIPLFKQRLEVVQFPAEERAKLVAASGDIWDGWVKEQEAAGRPGREILTFVKAEVAKYTH
ncbi:MAG TPA: TRAP transporter substrate-binding protein DctP [Hyphomicrobiaceae bacterium]|jgi:TRAP-type C4-dicarboxylate transport system substrate-binding protein|nr:TRAP transporter substrate-binding protein DctP [Hyphomicrobiaceae bacterium]